MQKIAVVALALMCVTASARAQDSSAEDLARRTVERRAVEAVIWGMPAVNYELTLEGWDGSGLLRVEMVTDTLKAPALAC